MPSPSTSLATLRPELAGSLMQFDLAADRQGFIGHRVLPVFEAGKASGDFGKITVASLLQNRETKRTPGAGYARGNWQFTKDSYACEEHGAEEPVDDNQAAMYSDYFNAEQVSAQRAIDVVLRNAERRIADLIFNSTTWTGAALTTSVGTPWSTVATAVPITDVFNAVLKVYDNSGMWANALVINRRIFKFLQQNSQIVDKCKAQGFHDVIPGQINEAMLAQAFDLDEIIVAGSSKNTANEGQTAAFGQIWPNANAMICRVARTSDIQEPCIGRVFHWSQDGSSIGGTVESYREEQVRADIIRCRHQVDEKVLYTEMGHLLTNIAS